MERKRIGYKLNDKGKRNLRKLFEILVTGAVVGWILMGYWFLFLIITGGGM